MLCLGERQLYANKYAVLAAAQKAVLTGGTVSLGNGQFATIGGEAWHVYQCPKIKVQAIDAEECYDSLPVQLSPQDHDRLVEFERQQQYAEQQQLQMGAEEFINSTSVQFFLEPHSHLISTISASTPCLPQFAAYYQNDQGQWVTADLAIRTVAALRTLQPLNPEEFKHSNRKHPDFTLQHIQPCHPTSNGPPTSYRPSQRCDPPRIRRPLTHFSC